MEKLSQTQNDTFVCPICGHTVANKHRTTHEVAERWVLDKIKEAHPEWVEQNGVCTKCYDFYNKL